MRLEIAVANQTIPDEGKPELPALDTQELAERISALAWEVKALDLRVLRVLEMVNYSDWFVVMSGRSDRHVAAIRDHLDDTLRKEDRRRPLSIEGQEQNQWVVMDYGQVVVHIFYEPVRAFYELEKLWADAPELPLTPPDDLTLS